MTMLEASPAQPSLLPFVETGEQGEKRTAFVDDLPLFSAVARRAETHSRESEPDHALRDALAALDPDSLSPRDALEALYRLTALARLS